MQNALNVTYTSRWSETGDIETDAKLNLETGEVFDIEDSDVEAEGCLVIQFITVKDSEYRVHDSFDHIEDEDIHLYEGMDYFIESDSLSSIRRSI